MANTDPLNTDLHCTPAPAPVPQEPSAKAEIACGDECERPRTGTGVIFTALLVIALIAGAVWGFVSKRPGGNAASASAEVRDEETAAIAAIVTGPGEVPAECVGEIVDVQRRWYCTDFLPFARVAAADHRRIDRLEAARNPGNPGLPRSLWVVIVLLGAFNVALGCVIMFYPRKAKPPTG